MISTGRLRAIARLYCTAPPHGTGRADHSRPDQSRPVTAVGTAMTAAQPGEPVFVGPV
jgi:hypothetical protein